MSLTGGLSVKPIAEGLFTWPASDPHLIGSRCLRCGTYLFPRHSSCPKCLSTDVATTLLGTSGNLWSWTVQRFPPKAPPYRGPIAESFSAYGVGYVELPEQLIVESLLTVADPEALHIGMAMRLVIVPFGTDATFAFSPALEE